MGFITDGDNIGPLQAGDGGITRIHGTESQINVVENGREVTLSTPQDIAQDSQPVFRGVTLGAYPGANGSDAASVDYVINMISGAKPKGVVKAVMVTAAPMVGEQVIDTVTCSPGDRVLRNVPDTPELNGIYDVQEAAWTRAINNDSWDEMPGAIVIASDGEAFGGSRWVCDAVDGGTINVTANTWVMLRDPASVPEAPVTQSKYVRTAGAWEAVPPPLSLMWNLKPTDYTLVYYVSGSAQLAPFTTTGMAIMGSSSMADARTKMETFAHFRAPLDVDLNTLGSLDSAGAYRQPSNDGATSEHHYPLNRAGTLLVVPSAYGCQQEYTMYMDPRKFMRALTGPFDGTGPWSEWVEIQRMLPWNNTHTAFTVLGHDDDGAEVRRYYYEGILENGSLSSNVKLIVNNGLMVERPDRLGQWHSMINIPPNENHISVLYTDGTLRLYIPTGSVWAGSNYKGYVTVVMA
ncbi:MULTISPECIES: pyocin knob domain-containing protein [Enterobacter]|uniref:pyocin knob domain-containing protein n=1 Tax=Enterobacter TaxID=547 RepID=UPI002235CE46|nr:pyocin knob domain-containing protein [Enterobacter mori]MCW4985712.1 pyocin knob domain-containing protein [Enterobacter mori]